MNEDEFKKHYIVDWTYSVDTKQTLTLEDLKEARKSIERALERDAFYTWDKMFYAYNWFSDSFSFAQEEPITSYSFLKNNPRLRLKNEQLPLSRLVQGSFCDSRAHIFSLDPVTKVSSKGPFFRYVCI